MQQALLWAAAGTGFTFSMTALGAAMVFFMKKQSTALMQRIFLGFAARSNDRGIGLEPAHPGDRGDRTGRGRRVASGVRRLCSRHPAYAAAGRPAAASAQRCGTRRRTAVLVPTHDAACTRGNPAQYSRRNGRRPVVCTRRTAWRQQGTGRGGRCARARASAYRTSPKGPPLHCRCIRKA